MTNSPSTPGVVSDRLDKGQLAENFSDLHAPLDGHEAMVAEDHCYICHDAPCMAACPTTIDIPLFFARFQRVQPRLLRAPFILGGMCVWVWPAQTLCEEVSGSQNCQRQAGYHQRIAAFCDGFVDENRYTLI